MVLSRLSEVSSLTADSGDGYDTAHEVYLNWTSPCLRTHRVGGSRATQFLTLDEALPSRGAASTSDFLCGPAQSSKGVLGRGSPSSFSTIHIRMQLPPGMSVDRVTQLPLWEEGQIGGRSSGRDIAVSLERDSARHAAQAMDQRAGAHIDEDQPRALVTGREFPSELKARPKMARGEEASAMANLPDPPAQEDAPADTSSSTGSANESDLLKRIAKLEREAKTREANLQAALAQAGDRLDIPQGVAASKCCSCNGVVTFAPSGKCICPLGEAETRPAAAGCQATAASFKGRAECADSCREAFWGKDRADLAKKGEAKSGEVLAAASDSSNTKKAGDANAAPAKALPDEAALTKQKLEAA